MMRHYEDMSDIPFSILETEKDRFEPWVHLPKPVLNKVHEAQRVPVDEFYGLARACVRAKSNDQDIQVNPDMILGLIARLIRASMREDVLCGALEKERVGDRKDVLVYPPRKVDPFDLNDLDGVK